MKTKITLEVPQEVSRITGTFRDAGFEGYLVGGCVRDLLLNKQPADWDITTNASPQQIQDLFEHTFYENDYGTVGIVQDQVTIMIDELKEKKKNTNDSDVIRETNIKISLLETYKTIEATPYRTESTYSDNRRPDQVTFAKKIDEDLSRRDFTCNALAYNVESKELVDLFGGVNDIQNLILKTVGNPEERFSEDALRIMRAVRQSVQHDFIIEKKTQEAILDKGSTLQNIAKERIRDELVKIVESKEPMRALFLARDLQILQYIAPDLVRGIDIDQNGAHVYDVFEHLIRTMQHGADRDWSLIIRLAGLFHDISKPETRRWSKEKSDWTFYGHEVVGARVTKKALQELKFSNEVVTRVTTLVRWHMFFSDPDKITLSAVRRIIRNVGPENVWDLIRLRICDRIGMGRPKEKPYRLRQYTALMEEAMRSPISVKDLKINGDYMIAEMGISPGKRMGWILHALMDMTLFQPENNNKEFLVKQVLKLDKLSDKQLEEMSSKGKETIAEAEASEIKKIKRRNKVA